MKLSLKVRPMAMSFALVVLGSAVISPALAKPQAADPIPSIRQQYAAINKRAPRLRKVKKELSGFSTEGGELVAYFDGKAIVKMLATYFGETGRTIEEFYYQDGKLIFTFRKVLTTANLCQARLSGLPWSAFTSKMISSSNGLTPTTNSSRQVTLTTQRIRQTIWNTRANSKAPLAPGLERWKTGIELDRTWVVVLTRKANC